jgi:DNA-binding Lrp family transcriptional regulator
MLKKTQKQTTQQKILDYVKDNFEVSTKDIVDFLGISPQATHKNLKKLVEANQLIKIGTPPRVFYKIGDKDTIWLDFKNTPFEVINKTFLPSFKFIENSSNPIFVDLKNKLDLLLSEKKITKSEENELFKEVNEILDNLDLSDFLVLTPEGKIIGNLVGFAYWCNKLKLNFDKKYQEYLELQKKYQQFKTEDNNFVIATGKFKTSFKNDSQVDEVYYCDFYSIEIFGKTKLGNLLLHGKQSQNQKIINQVCYEVKDRIIDFVQKNKIDAVAFIPPTTPRKPQFMDEFQKILDLKLPLIKLEKIVNDIAIQQKTLKSSQDRIENAQNTIFVDDKRSFKNILLLDDAVGSGSTFNEVARKIRKKQMVKTGGKIYALAIVGSANGIVNGQNKFEVINEV